MKETLPIYWPEFVIDLAECDVSKFTQPSLEKFFLDLCKEIDMTPVQAHFWDIQEYDPENPKMQGTSGVQFISTSSITFHSMTAYKACTINIHSCKEFDTQSAALFCKKYFNGTIVNLHGFDHIIGAVSE